MQIDSYKKQEKKKDNGIHTQYKEITLETPKGKTNFRDSQLYLFLSLHYIECLQHNIRSLPTFETLIPKLELENHGLNIVRRKTVKNDQKKKFSGFSLEPPDPHCEYGFRF